MEIIDIYNLALGMIGHDRAVASIDESSTENVRCTREWDGARLFVLAGHDWNWLKQETPFIEGTTCTCELTNTLEYMYNRPTDIIRLIAVLDYNMRKPAYRAVNSMIYCAEPLLKFQYLEDETDPDNWPHLIQAAIAAELSARIARPMTGNVSIVKDAMVRAQKALMDAKIEDAAEMRISGSDGDRYSKSRR